MMKINKTLVGILMMVLLVGTGFAPATNAQAEEKTDAKQSYYDADGYDIDGYDVNGYDVNGYDKDGYNEDGYDIYGYDKQDAFKANKIVASIDDSGKASVRVLNVKGDEIDSSNYTVSTKEISTQKGCTTYKVTITCDELYGNKVLTKNVMATPKNIIPFGIRKSIWPDGKITYTVQFNYSKSDLEKLDGVQYVIGKDKDFKKIYAKATTKLKTPKHAFALDGMLDKTFSGKKGNNYYIKYRGYSIVDDKKIYSKWVYYTHKF